MLIKDMFQKPIDREIQGVIIVGQDENANVKQELEEYVVTKELQKHFADFFSAYKKGINGTTSKMGVWISGFFGSGKSHFLKILSYILENREVGGKRAIDYFADDKKIVDPTVLADMRLASKTPTDVVLFNIDSKSDLNGKQNKDAIVNVFLKVFNEMQGFCGAMPFLADLERRLTDKGRFDEFKKRFAAEYGEAWEDARQDFDFIQDTIVDILSNMNFMSKQAARNWCEKAAEPYHISIEDFAKRVKSYIDRKGNNHHVVFLVDEVGQYIGDDTKLMLNLQTVTEELGKACNGKAWVIVTSQQDIYSATKVKGNDFSKIQGRFDTRISMSSADVDTIIKKRILEKNDTAAQALRLLYNKKATAIKNLIAFNDSVDNKLYANENDFFEVYPFVPYQFNLLAIVLTSIRAHGASGKHISEGERSMLAMFKESAMAYMESNEGTIVPFYAFYDTMKNFLDYSHRSVILKSYENSFINPEGKEKDVFAIDVLKTLLMIKYCNDICNANIDNIVSLMITNIDDDRIELKAKVEKALKVLIRQMLVQKNGDNYVFLTIEEKEINREIDSKNVELAEIINKVSEMIFEDIYTERKYRYPVFNGRYSFSLNKTVDDHTYKANHGCDIGVRILTPVFEGSTDETTLRMMSGQSKEVLVVLPDDRTFMDEIQSCLKIEKFLRLNTSSANSKYKSIKEAKRSEMREHSNSAKLFLTESLKQAAIYVNGDKVQLNSKDVTSRINEAIGRLVTTVYHKLSYIDTAMSEDDIRKMMRSASKPTNISDSKEVNTHALEDVLQFISDNTHMNIKTSMKTLKDRFMKAPYGFVEDDVHWLAARLFKRGDIAFTVNSESITLLNKTENEIIDLITKKAYAEKLLMEHRIRVPDKEKKITRDVMKELFRISGISDDENALMDNFINYTKNMLVELDRLEILYEKYSYPGKKIIQNGKKLLNEISLAQSPIEFFCAVSKKKDALIEFAYEFESVTAFFKGEQKTIFDRALHMIEIYNDSKTYIVDDELEKVAADIQLIIHKEKPYEDIPKLPELLEMFENTYSKLLNEQEAPVLASIDESRNRVLEVLDGKTYKEAKSKSYREQFEEIRNGAKHCSNISVLRGFADRAEALKLRLLNEMDGMDAAIAKKQAEEERRCLAEKSGQGPHKAAEFLTEYKVKKRKNVAIKSVTRTSSWRLESEEDVEKYVSSLKERLIQEMEDDTVLNVEF